MKARTLFCFSKGAFLAAVLVFLVLSIWIKPTAAITWGSRDTGNAYPYVGVMGILRNGEPIGMCSCTLIGANVVLTAGHCTDYASFLLQTDGTVTVGVSFGLEPNPSSMLSVDDIITHPNFSWNRTSNPYDVGLLILDTEVVGIDPATLAGEGFLDVKKAERSLRQGSVGAKFTVVGYGVELLWPPPVITYSDDPIRRIAETEYRGLLKAWLLTSQNQATGDGGTCSGDSGGPIIWEDDANDPVVVGVTSWGDPQCISSGFYYRTDIPEILLFIRDIINN